MLLRSKTSLGSLSSFTRELGLYAAVALIVPGGSLIVFLFWVFRQRAWRAAHESVQHTHRADGDDGYDALSRR
jgi:hypothetical protein